MLTSKLLAPRR